ncbi:sensor histidine kinase [Lederbergia citrisecunda]|nr:HAMP domain-containing sensor histidine kinase [Lederbergia citrisecunda]
MTITNQEIEEFRNRYGNLDNEVKKIQTQYKNRIKSVQNTINQDTENIIKSERDDRIEDLSKIFSSDDYVQEKIIQEKEERYKEYQRNLENYDRKFKYYFRNSQTGEIYTNLSYSDSPTVENYLKNDNMIYITDYIVYGDDPSIFNLSNKNKISLDSYDSWYEGKIGIPKSLPSYSPIIRDNKEYMKSQVVVWLFVLLSIVASIFCYNIGKKIKRNSFGSEKAAIFYNRIPIDIRSGIFIITGTVGGVFLVIGTRQLPYILQNSSFQGKSTLVALGLAVLPVGLTAVQGEFLFREISEWENFKIKIKDSFLNRKVQQVRNNFQDAFLNRRSGTQLFLILGLIFFLGAGLITLYIHPIAFLIYAFILVIIGFPLVTVLVKKVGYFNYILEATNTLSVGTLDSDIPVNGKFVLSTIASNLNSINQKVKTTQSEQVKSERLKTELITNVSHDLRTPLTSIITYTDLLKQRNLSVKEREHYLYIIDQKSKRLKVLIDDLFEVSKMASGNIKLILAKVDLVQLLQQALGEYNDKIKESSLLFRVSKPEKPIYASVDGQKLWRVFENLIGNILKYSLDNSRVYISVCKSEAGNEGFITFKNVSKYELNGNHEELFERFKRGDMSRHTEGSGLGLAIAKSIVDLHDGSLEIETDGDLFKVTVILKLYEV